MTRWPRLLVGSLSLLWVLAVGAAPVLARCVPAGAVLDVPTPGYLKSATPNLTIDFERGGVVLPVQVVSKTTARMRIRIPATGLLSDTRFKVRHTVQSGGTRVVASARTCVLTAAGNSGQTAAGTSGAGGARLATPRSRLTPATRFDVAAPSGAPEIILIGSAGAVSRAEGVVSQAGGTILRRRSLDGLGLGMVMVDMAGFLTENELRAELSRRGIDVNSARHNVYGVARGSPNYARRLLTGNDASGCRLRRTVRIGIIDGPVNTAHPALQGASIETATVLDRSDVSASADHGTGIAGLIVSPEVGLAPGAALFAVTAVSRAGTREVAKLEDIAAALDWMIERKMDVVNMSLAGPENDALARAIEAAARRGVIMVAAVGNNARADVAYPASDARVIGVTAIDADKRLYRQASRGTAVDFAAPGVDVRVPTSRRMAFRSGTSYASAALTALVAFELANGRARSPDEIRRALAGIAEDLGSSGRDTEYGLGMPSRNGC